MGIFSDEAHHTYGNQIDRELKRVRETVNYINKETDLIAVVNTTGTPYYKRQMLREVVAWYSLGAGIRDNILKSLRNGIVPYPVGTIPDEDIIRSVIKDFFKNYGDVALPDGSKAKIAFYFKTQEHLEASHLHIQNVLAETGKSPTIVLVNTQKSSPAEIDEFNRLNDPKNQKRILLLIGKGVEGWNCPSLFACALIKEQTSGTFVLQASTRCLRQVDGNTHPARIFLDTKNRDILDKQLAENFGTSIRELRGQDSDTEEVVIRIRKTEMPKLEISRQVRRVVWTEKESVEIQLHVPTDIEETSQVFRSILTPDFAQKGTTSPLTGLGELDEVEVINRTTDCYTLARRLSRNYHLPFMETLKTLKNLYPEGEVPNKHLTPLYQQVSTYLKNYKEIKEEVTEALALIHIYDEAGKPLFEQDDDGCYIHRLRLLKRTADRMRSDRLLFDDEDLEDTHDVSFHYAPYNFDTRPEREFFETILATLNIAIEDVKIFLFTGGLTDPKKTDFHFEYKGIDGNYHRYFPDFVIVKKTGEFYIVEIKSDKERDDPVVVAKRKAVEHLEQLQQDARFKYRVIYTTTSMSLQENAEMSSIFAWIRNDEPLQTDAYENILREEKQ